MFERVFIDDPPSFDFRDQVVHINFKDGGRISMSMRTFRISIALATKALALHDTKQATVLPFWRRCLDGGSDDHAANP